MTRSRMLLLPAALALYGCGKATPCSGSKCLDVAGEYLVTYNPTMACPDWAYQPAPSSAMTVVQNASAIEVDLQPSTYTPAHALHGTLDVNGAVSANETAPDPRLNLHYGQLNGLFTPGTGGLIFQGTLTLQFSGIPTDGGADQNCTGPYTVTAQRTSGEPPDAGPSDGGKADAGDGG